MARERSDRVVRRAWALGALALSAIVAGSSVYVVVHVLSAYEFELRSVYDTRREQIVKVPVVARTLGAGHVVQETDLQIVELSAEYVPLTAIQSPEDIVGRTVIERILQGELVRLERLAPPTSGQGLTAIVPTGMRAVSLDLSHDQQVSGFVEPGDGVDLLVTLPGNGKGVDAETITLVQGANVLAVNEKISETVRGEEIRRQQVTLAVAPDVVEKITHALDVGQAKLTLRSEIDMTNVETNGTRVSELLGNDQKRLSVQQFRERITEADVDRMIEIVHGANKQREAVIDPHLIRGLN